MSFVLTWWEFFFIFFGVSLRCSSTYGDLYQPGAPAPGYEAVATTSLKIGL